MIELLEVKQVEGLDCAGALGCVHPHPILDGEYLLFYTPYPPEEKELPYLAKSRDGLRFKEVCKRPLLSLGDWDSHHLADVDVLGPEPWFMYYAGASVNGGKSVSIGVSVGDGRCMWDKKGIALSHGRIATTPTVVKIYDEFIMYYSTRKDNSTFSLNMAVSSDGISFKTVREVLTPYADWNSNGLNHPHVSIFKEKWLVLLFLGYDGQCYSLGYAFFSLEDPGQPYFVSKTPILSNRESIFCRLWRKSNLKRIFNNARLLYAKLGLPCKIKLPFWKGLHIYRSALLTTPDRRVISFNNGISYLYISAYDGILNVPSIGMYKVRIYEPNSLRS